MPTPKTPKNAPAAPPETDLPDDTDAPATPDPIDEPNAPSDDPNEPGEPKSTGKPEAGVKEAAAAAKKAVEEDLAREVPILETYKAASLRKQADWETDAKEFFRDEDFEGKRRAERIAEMDKMDLVNRAGQRERDAEQAKVLKAAEAKRMLTEAEMHRAAADNLDKLAAALGA